MVNRAQLKGLAKSPILCLSLYLMFAILFRLGFAGNHLAYLLPLKTKLVYYVVLGIMPLFCCAALLIGHVFLSFATHVGVFRQLISHLTIGFLALLSLCTSVGSEYGAALVVFSFMSFLMVGMTALSFLRTLGGNAPECFFFAAALCGMAGTSYSTLLLIEILPVSASTYGTLELAALAEVSLLMGALGYRSLQQKKAFLLADRLAHRDPLTDLYNRRAFIELARPLWSTAQRNQRPLIMIMLDIDYFKRINDQFGHETGDQILLQTANLLARVCRSGDLLCRWGGEEFLLMVPETDMRQGLAFAERIRYSLEEIELPNNANSIFLTASLGVAERGNKSTLEDLIKAADMQLYKAKHSGRNRSISEACQPMAKHIGLNQQL
jgi:diguanylate cyclase (GGDEF)-like protein